MRAEVKTLVIYSVVFAIIEIGFYVVFASDFLSAFYSTESVRVVLTALKENIHYFVIGFFAFFVFLILPKLYSGIIINRLSKTISVLGAVFIVQFCFSIPLLPLEMRQSGGLFFVTELTMLGFGTAYYLLKDYNQKFLPELVKALAFFVIAFLSWEIMARLPISSNADVGTAFAVGFAFAGFCMLLYPLRFSENKIIKKVGVWFTSSASNKFILGFFLTIYFSLIRPYLGGFNSEYLMLGEWGLIGIVTGSMLLWVRSNLKAPDYDIFHNQWVVKEDAPKKHKQQIFTKSTAELKTVNEYVNDFVKYGLKTDLLLFIVQSCYDKGLPFYKFSKILRDFIEYKDNPAPRFGSLGERDFVVKQNLQNRREVLAITIEKLNEAFRS